MPAPPDVFDPYGDFSDVVPVPVEEAIKDFQDFWAVRFSQHQRDWREDLRNQTSTVESRKTAMNALQREQKIVEVRLFRSIMAARES